MFETVVLDGKLAVRRMLRERSVTAIALASLAIGIAANSTVFSLVQAVEFPNLLYPAASSLLLIESRNPARQLSALPVSAPDAIDLAASARTLDRPGLTADLVSSIPEAATPARVRTQDVCRFFEALGVSPACVPRWEPIGNTSCKRYSSAVSPWWRSALSPA